MRPPDSQHVLRELGVIRNWGREGPQGRVGHQVQGWGPGSPSAPPRPVQKSLPMSSGSIGSTPDRKPLPVRTPVPVQPRGSQPILPRGAHILPEGVPRPGTPSCATSLLGALGALRCSLRTGEGGWRGVKVKLSGNWGPHPLACLSTPVLPRAGH